MYNINEWFITWWDKWRNRNKDKQALQKQLEIEFVEEVKGIQKDLNQYPESREVMQIRKDLDDLTEKVLRNKDKGLNT